MVMISDLKMLKKGNLSKLIAAICFISLGIASLIYTPVEFMYDLRLRMLPGTPPYSFWADPPDNLVAKVYIFNVTNSERFLDGTDPEIHLQEIGPIIYREKFTHSNIVLNENSTLSYTITRTPVFLPERNTIDLNSTIIAPNLAMLVMASYFADSSFFVKAGIKILFNKYECQPFVNTTIYNFLENATYPVLEPAKALVSSLVPSTNVGILNQMYLKRDYNITVRIGPKYGHEDFFSIVNVNGVENVPNFRKCIPSFNHTSEATLFPQYMRRDQTVNAWKAVLCMALTGEYAGDTTRYGMTGYRYIIPSNSFNRTKPKYDDCYRGVPELPDGLRDVSSCYNGYPFAASFPHFLNADPVVYQKIQGLNPDPEKHGSYLDLERMSGVPFGGRAIFQMNIIFKEIYGFGTQMEKFSNMYLPLTYVGYEIEGLPWTIYSFLYFLAVILPNTQLILSIILLAGGLSFLYSFYRYFRLLQIAKTSEEEEKFIKINILSFSQTKCEK